MILQKSFAIYKIKKEKQNIMIMNIQELETALNETIKDLEIVHPTIEPGTHQYFKAMLLSAESYAVYMTIVYQLYNLKNETCFRMITPPKTCNVPTLLEKINAYRKEHSTNNNWFISLRNTANYQLLKIQDPIFKFQQFKEHFLKFAHPCTTFCIKTEKMFQNEIYTTFVNIYTTHEPHNVYISAQYTYHTDKPWEPIIFHTHLNAYDLFNYVQEYISQEIQSKETQCISIESSLYDKPFYIYM